MDLLQQLKAATELIGGTLLNKGPRTYNIHAPLGGAWTKNGEKVFTVEWDKPHKRTAAIKRAIQVVEGGVKRSPGRPPVEEPRINKSLRVLPIVHKFISEMGNAKFEQMVLDSPCFLEWESQQC